jgi:hypothetical protein
MNQRKSVDCYGYVERPYDRVHALLRREPIELLQRATGSASARARALVTSLKLDMGGIEVGVDVRAQVKGMREEHGIAGLDPVTRVDIGWEAARGRAFFPLMSAQLSAWPITSTETQLELQGEYEPPFGAVGAALDAVLGHRIAEAAVERLLQDLLEQMRRELPPSP